jgi:photosystem II stability/assembly factor-like uncharacterized protein
MRVLVLVGTKKGGFILESDRNRANWSLRGPFAEGWPLLHVNYDPSTGTIYAGGGSEWFGPAVWRSTDRGKTWSHSGEGLTYGDDGPKVKRIWHVMAAHGALYAGVEPAGLFRSDDGGVTWTHVRGLRDHPTCPDWGPGNGGLCLHSIVAHPTDPRRMWVGISAVGTFYTEDGGATWEPRNRAVRAEFLPNKYPETGQCVHKLLGAPGDGSLLYQQNHCGVYRSFDAGANWEEVSGGLPSDFGFPFGVHPRDPRTVWVIPLNGDSGGRFMPEGRAAVWRSRSGGDSWERCGNGLPQEHAFMGVLREAMATDTLNPAGVYFGSSSGQIFGSADEGDSWSILTGYLPSPVYSVEAAVIED